MREILARRPPSTKVSPFGFSSKMVLKKLINLRTKQVYLALPPWPASHRVFAFTFSFTWGEVGWYDS